MKNPSKTIRLVGSLLFSMIFIVACSSDEDSGLPPTLSSAKEILSFSFSQSNNNIPVSNTVADVTGQSVTIFLPPGADVSNLVSTFQVSPKATAAVNGTLQQSAVSANDFSSSITYQVTAEDGSTANYQVNVVTDFEAFDAKMEAIRSQFNVPGMQVAISRDGKLMYRKSYGLADSIGQQTLENNHRFRIAGLSKVIKRIAMLKALEDGLLSLDDTIFGDAGILGNDFGMPPLDPEIENITVAHLLGNTSGWTNDPIDPSAGFPGLSQAELISEVVDNKPLAHSPGSATGASNIGFIILGRVLEKVSGMSLDVYVQQQLLQPLGIDQIELAGNLQSDRQLDEVVYYTQTNFDPYMQDIERRDNYISSAQDLIRFMRGFDRLTGVADIITPETLAVSNLNGDGWIFSGGYSGLTCAIGNPEDPFTFSILANTSVGVLQASMITEMQDEITARTLWPSYDLFDVD